MEKEIKTKLKAELLEELSEQINDKVEAEVEEEVSEELAERSRYAESLDRFKVYFIGIAATIMALGQFSEAVTLIEDGVDSLRSRFTNTVEYGVLSNIHVGNTEAYIEDLIGNAQVSRAIDDEIVADYHYNNKFLLTIFNKDKRVIAYTVIPLVDDFHWEVSNTDEIEWTLQVSTYSEFPANPKLYAVDHSKTASYYIESLDTGRTGLFVNSYLGNVSIGDRSQSMSVIALYNKEVTGTDEEIFTAQTKLRESTSPNLFGAGKLDLELIQKSILTGAEFSSYFGR